MIMKKLISLIFVVIFALCPVLSSCTSEAEGVLNISTGDEIAADVKHNSADDKLTFYCLGEYGDELYEFIKKYNKYCAVNDTYEDSVEFVYFESTAELNAVLSTELMAGKGPDILSITQGFPFEKLVRNSSLADIDEILENNNSSLDFNDYNKVIMDSGIFGGKRLIVPLYYRADILYTTEERLGMCTADTQNFTFESALNSYKNTKTDMYLLNPYSVDAFYFTFVRRFADFEKGTTDFESEEFSRGAEELKKLLLNEKSYSSLKNYEFQYTEDHSEYLFTSNEIFFYGGSLTDVARTYMNALSDEKNLTVCPNLNRNGKVAANVEIGFAINANCKKQDKAAKLIEYLLSDESQGYFSGGRNDSSSSGVALPVKNSVFDKAVEEALEFHWYFSEELSETDEYVIELVKQKNKFLTDEYIPLIEDISSANLYGYFSQTESYLYQNVIGEIISDYLNDKITTQKLVSRLTSALNIYMNE